MPFEPQFGEDSVSCSSSGFRPNGSESDQMEGKGERNYVQTFGAEEETRKHIMK